MSDLRPFLRNATMLKQLWLHGNPLGRLGERMYRPTVVRHSRSVEEVDDRAVLMGERAYVSRLRERFTHLEEQKMKQRYRRPPLPQAPTATKGHDSTLSGSSPLPTLHSLVNGM